MLNYVKYSVAEVIRLPKSKRQVLPAFLQVKRQEKMFIRLIMRLKTIKSGNNDPFLKNMQQEKRVYCF